MEEKRNKCIFLDRDGVINVDFVDYVYTIEKFEFLPGVQEALQKFKDAGYLLVVITNQSGIVKGIYKEEDVWRVHNHIQEETGHLLDGMYLAPNHEKYTASLSRKPGSLMLERAIAKYNVDVAQSWMIGDKERDLLPGKKVGLSTAVVADTITQSADIQCNSLLEASNTILNNN